MLSEIDNDTAEVTELVRDRVSVCRDRGLDQAFEKVGRELGITPRRVRSYWLRQVTTLTVVEWRKIVSGATEWLSRDAARIEAQNALLRQRLAAGVGLGSGGGGFACASSWGGTERRGQGVADRKTALMAIAVRSVSE